jgi:hypothetical protein
MADMVRKQVYLTQRQVAFLKRLAKRRGVSETEIMRQAIEREAAAEDVRLDSPPTSALNELVQAALERRDHGLTGEPYHWRREDAYEERLRKIEHVFDK